MLLRILSIIAIIFLISACTSNKNSGGYSDQSDTSSVIKQYMSDSQGAETFSLLSKSNVEGRRAGDRVFFAFDSSAISSDQKSVLDSQVKYLSNNSDSKITIEGHCDERGTREYNIALGERRAQAVKNYLVNSGIDASRIKTLSFGKERPAVVGSNSTSWAENRRAVTILSNYN